MEKYILNHRVSKIAKFGKISGYTNLAQTRNYLGFMKSNFCTKSSLNRIPFYSPNGKIFYFKRADLDQNVLGNRQATVDEIYEKPANVITNKRKSLS